MNIDKLLIGAIAAVAGGVAVKTAQVIKNRKEDTIKEVEIENEFRDKEAIDG